MNARELALTMLMEITEDKKLSHLVLREGLKRNNDLIKQDRAFITRIVTGCVKQTITLDYDIEKFSKVKVKKMKPLIRNILRMGTYQIKYMDQIPDSAVCNESVKIVKKRGMVGLSGFVNGILRSMSRQRERLFLLPEHVTKEEAVSYEFSMPLWLCNYFIDLYGEERTRRIFNEFSKDKETTVRITDSDLTEQQLFESLKQQKVNVQHGKILTDAYLLSEYDSLDKIKEFQEGKITVQDESSMLVGKISGVQKGDTVIDVCAAPGGKTMHLASIMKGTGTVLSFDKSQKKVDLIIENARRLNLNNVTARVIDGREYHEEFKETADVVICDVPCSGLGVLKKKPDIKYNMTQDAMKELCILQREIVKVAASYVKPGKVLIYSTCTINPRENEEAVQFIKELGFVTEDLTSYLPEKLRNETVQDGYRQVLPDEWSTDGFFIARLRKR